MNLKQVTTAIGFCIEVTLFFVSGFLFGRGEYLTAAISGIIGIVFAVLVGELLKNGKQ